MLAPSNSLLFLRLSLQLYVLHCRPVQSRLLRSRPCIVFFTCGLISSNSIALEAASLIELSSAVSHCKFEASDFSGDEVVLLKIMAVIQVCLCGSVGKGLGDIEVYKMLETVLTTCCQMRLSGELKRFFMQTHSFLAQRHFADPQNTQRMPWSEPCSPDYIP